MGSIMKIDPEDVEILKKSIQNLADEIDDDECIISTLKIMADKIHGGNFIEKLHRANAFVSTFICSNKNAENIVSMSKKYIN